jgi:hypothetical protein
MLSTPTASTRNGTTSMMINVAGLLAKLKIPKEQRTEPSTIMMPPNARLNLESIWKVIFATILDTVLTH